MAWRSNLKEINPEYSLEGLMLNLQYFGHLIGRVNSLEKTLVQEEKGTIEDETVGWHQQLNGHKFEQTLGDSKRQRSLVLQSTGSQRVGYDLATEQQQKRPLAELLWKLEKKKKRWSYIKHCAQNTVGIQQGLPYWLGTTTIWN